MKRSEELYDQIGQINEKYVEEAYFGDDAANAPKRGVVLRRVLIAAAAVVAVVGALALAAALGMQKPRGSAAVDAAVKDEKEAGNGQTTEVDLSGVKWLASSDEERDGETCYPEGVDLSPKTLGNGKVSFPHGDGWTLYYALEEADDSDRFAVLVSGKESDVIPRDETRPTHEKIISDMRWEGYSKQFQEDTRRSFEIIARIRRERNVSREEAEVRVRTDPEYVAMRDSYNEACFKTECEIGKYELELNRDAYDYLCGHCDSVVCTLGDPDEGALAYFNMENGYCVAVMTKAQIMELDSGEYDYSLRAANLEYERMKYNEDPMSDSNAILCDDSCLTQRLAEEYEKADGGPLKVHVYLALTDLEPENVDEMLIYPSELFDQLTAEHFGMTEEEYYLTEDVEMRNNMMLYKRELMTESYRKIKSGLFHDGEIMSGWENADRDVLAVMSYDRAMELSAKKEVYMISYADLRPEDVVWSDAD